MDNAESKLVRSWLAKALNDLKSVRVFLSVDPEGPLDAAIYHCQQAAKKAVKAFLVSQGIAPEKTLDVRKLVVQASAFEPKFNDYIGHAAALTPYAWEFRYPGDFTETYPTRDEFDEAWQQAQAIYDFVLSLLPKQVQP